MAKEHRIMIFKRKIPSSPSDAHGILNHLLEHLNSGLLNMKNLNPFGFTVVRDSLSGPKGLEEMGLWRHLDLFSANSKTEVGFDSKVEGIKRGAKHKDMRKHIIEVYVFGEAARPGSLVSIAIKKFLRKNQIFEYYKGSYTEDGKTFKHFEDSLYGAGLKTRGLRIRDADPDFIA